jgi:epoxyqueuosine reductase
MIRRLSEVWDAVRRVTAQEGVSRVGASDLTDAHQEVFGHWIDSGNHATMHYLARNREARQDPAKRFPWARSAIVVLVPYAAERPDDVRDSLTGHIARYAMGDDYHDVLDGILRVLEKELVSLVPDIRTWRYVDTGPLSDRALAAQAGLGWVGRNSMIINEEIGSYTFIGTLLTSLENDIAADAVADRCGTCTRCVDACPTDAILPSRTVVSEQCISYATIEHRGALSKAMENSLEGNIFGCDICQEVCPWNGRPAEGHPAFAPRAAYGATPVSDLLRFEQADFSSLFRNSAIKRAKLAGMKRNIQAVLAAKQTG